MLDTSMIIMLRNEQLRREERLASGQCQDCGQQLYQVKPRGGKRALSIPGRVQRGHCLHCSHQKGQDTNSTVSSSMNSSALPLSTDECDFREAPSSHTDSIAEETAYLREESAMPCPLRDPSLGSTTSDATDSRSPRELRRIYTDHIEPGHAIRLPASNIMIWCNGDVYIGDFTVNTVRHGHGTLHFAAGGEYVGDWHHNEMHGVGTRRYPNGNVYVGPYSHNRREGEAGRMYFANGDMYWGNWYGNNMHGQGRYYYASGQRFEGNLVHNQRSGKGKVQRTDGALEIFQYVNDERVGKGVRFSVKCIKAWVLWKPNKAINTDQAGKVACIMERKRITIAEAVSLVYEIETASASHETDMMMACRIVH